MPAPRELVFRVQRDSLGQLVARCFDPELVAFGATRDELVDAIHEAIRRHYDSPAAAPATIRLHHVDE